MLRRNIALNPIQWSATPDGWVDDALAPEIDTQLSVIAENGFLSVHVSPRQAAQRTAFRQRLEAHGLAAGPGIMGCNVLPTAAEQRSALEANRRIAANYASLGIRTVFLASNMPPTHPRVEQAAVGAFFDRGRLDRFVDVIGQHATVMRSEGVIPAFHPHVGSWIETEPEVRAVMDGIPDDVLSFGPDIGHLAWAGMNPVALLTEYADRIEGVHIKDYRSAVIASARARRASYRSAVCEGLWVEPGRGDADIAAVLSLIPEASETWFVVEVDRPDADTPEESIARCGAWLRSL